MKVKGGVTRDSPGVTPNGCAGRLTAGGGVGVLVEWRRSMGSSREIHQLGAPVGDGRSRSERAEVGRHGKSPLPGDTTTGCAGRRR